MLSLAERDRRYGLIRNAMKERGIEALIVKGGKVFVHRRGPDRAFLPNCWDIPGGHVEPGERLLEALEREVEEETGWRVVGQPTLINVVDWQTAPADPSSARREFDFLVSVEGDLDNPRLEVPKQIEFRWIGRDETPILDENRGRDNGLVRQVVELALGIGGGPEA